jgi:hypothetical protein
MNTKGTEPYLKQLARHLASKYPSDLGESCIVFPNRRAGVFFMHHLTEVVAGACWAPAIKPMNLFLSELSGLRAAEPVELNFELYRIYSGFVKNPEPYDEFYFWGEMMIRDFNDIDKYLVNAQDLFSNLSDLKEIEQNFPYLDDEQKKIIRYFWQHFPGASELSREQSGFLGMWQLLPRLYTELRTHFLRLHEGYDGMIYRKAAEDIRNGVYPDKAFKRYVFAGFNALSRSEEIVFNHMRNSGMAEFYWDYDASYIENPVSEAGRFLRKNLSSYPQDQHFASPTTNLGRKRSVKVYSLPSDVLQTRKLQTLLSAMDKTRMEDFTDTAVILADEALIQPVLASLPGNIPSVNVTMGYPLRLTPVFSFTEALLQMQKNLGKEREKRKGKFWFRDVLAILNHPFIQRAAGEIAREKIRQINRSNLIYVGSSFFTGSPLLEKIFTTVNEGTELADYLVEVLEIAMPCVLEKEDGRAAEKEFYLSMKQHLHKLRELFRKSPPDTGIHTFIRLFRKILGSASIPFEGEPLRGLQIMGILESRLLDFDKVIVLSLNEGVMPRQDSGQSFVPANLRYAFGMPVRSDRDAIYAYYFYRLMQRAGEVHLLYNSMSDGLKSGEPSRYIYQMKYLFPWDYNEETVSFDITASPSLPVRVEKTPEVMEKLMEFTHRGSRKLSPSSVTTYLDCSLRFYFSYVLKLKEEDEAADEIDSLMLGKLLHKAMELLYEPYRGKVMDAGGIKHLTEDSLIKSAVDKAFNLEFFKTDEKADTKPEGRNIIVHGIVMRMVKQVLEQDIRRAPFLLTDTEFKIELLTRAGSGDYSIRLGGVIDRLEEQNGFTCIIDYKTGKALSTFKDIPSLFRWEGGKAHQLKGIFQTMLYAWMLKQMGTATKLKAGIYQLGEVFRKDFSPWIGLAKGSLDEDGLWLDEFGDHLNVLFSELFNPSLAFEQTEVESRCKYCSYKAICHREEAERE